METKDKLFPCPYSIAVRCCLEDPCMGCETFGKYRVGEEVPRFDPHLQVEQESGQILSPEEWNKIEREFIEWDNATHSNASQRQILDWFKEKNHSQFEKRVTDEDIEQYAKEYAESPGRDHGIYGAYYSAYKAGAKAMRDGKIK